jgi:membrane protein implicated in regulation of membrane protease activity
MPGLGEQLAVLPPLAKVLTGAFMLVLGGGAMAMQPWSVYSGILAVLALVLGVPLLLAGRREQVAQRVQAAELQRAKAELSDLRAAIAAVLEEKHGVERFLLERGYTSPKVRRWIALECDLPVRSPR